MWRQRGCNRERVWATMGVCVREYEDGCLDKIRLPFSAVSVMETAANRLRGERTGRAERASDFDCYIHIVWWFPLEMYSNQIKSNCAKMILFFYVFNMLFYKFDRILNNTQCQQQHQQCRVSASRQFSWTRMRNGCGNLKCTFEACSRSNRRTVHMCFRFSITFKTDK